jgi:FkbM family methyltransferase
MRSATGLPWRIRAARTLLRRLPRARYRLLSTFAPSRGRFIGHLATELGGARFHCDLADLLSREVCFTGMYEPPVTRVFRQHAGAGSVVADVGANWGYFTLLAAAAVGASGSVLALEPDPRQFEMLARNVALNGFSRVTCVQAAASASEGRLTLSGFADSDANRGVSRIGAAESTGRTFDVRAVSLDALTEGIPRVDLVKIDVEGAEDLVLEGMKVGLSAHRYQCVILELHPDLLRSRAVDPVSILETLTGYGYRGSTIDMSPAAYRRALHHRGPIDEVLLPLERWQASPWPHLVWLC